MNKRYYLFLFSTLLSFFNFTYAQPAQGKYPSLLWEITGPNCDKPSYLFGTMHVSSKVAFNLSDSFYLGIKNADVVALETNPQNWQEDMDKYEFDYSSGALGKAYQFKLPPNEYLTLSTLKNAKYEKWLEQALYLNSTTINSLLYRSYGNTASDFEEDTFLDMYIYQCGKRWGKELAGVEDYGRSMEIMGEAYADAAKEKKKKNRSYNDIDEKYSFAKMEEAYRKGDLDRLDSIQLLNRTSDAFDEKFLYLRNDIQAASIDSILRTKKTLFVGVGAAHLPGDRGVIEILRRKGYTLRPVFMRVRDNKHKEIIDKLRVPVDFKTQHSADGAYSVDAPGKLYRNVNTVYNAFETGQYADMGNGSYYMVTRVKTGALLWGHSSQVVLHKIDSLLYENIPGRILNKEKIERNGYKGFDITNRTRRGDVQRYNIFVTPFEVIVFKMSGIGEYVSSGEEAGRFFNSIVFHPYKANKTVGKFSPASGGFKAAFPHTPHSYNDGSWIYEATDSAGEINYQVIRTDVHNYSFVEEDSFDLTLMDESFGDGENIARNAYRKQQVMQGYPALDSKYIGVDSSVYLIRFLIKGPHYYTVIAHAKKEVPALRQFIQSFEVTPFIYGDVKERVDTSLFYTVKSPVFLESTKKKISMPQYAYYNNSDEDYEYNINEDGAVRSDVIVSDTTGEKIFVTFFKQSRYSYSEDSVKFYNEFAKSIMDDTTWIVKSKNAYTSSSGDRVWEALLSDTGSSRALRTKAMLRNGNGFILMAQTDTLSAPSAFMHNFFETFTPADTLSGYSPFQKKTAWFVEDFFSPDSVVRKRAIRNIPIVTFDTTDLSEVRKVIQGIDWKEKNYIDVKKSLVRKLGAMKNKATADYLKELYYGFTDTLELQYAALGSLVNHRNEYSFKLFQDIIRDEPPILLTSSIAGNSYSYNVVSIEPLEGSSGTTGDIGFIYGLYDSLPLTKAILPDILPLLNLDDYKLHVMRLLRNLIDSNIIKSGDYDEYFSKFYLEAKHELRKQAVEEKNAAIRKAEDDKENEEEEFNDSKSKDYGNERLSLYATLLLPFWDTHPNVQQLFNQMAQSNDKELKYDIFLKLLDKGKKVADTLPTFFAKEDRYLYRLYTDLTRMKKFAFFPKKYNDRIALGKSKLLLENTYRMPDSVVYVDKLPAEIKGKKGEAYFYKYKENKDDIYWRIAIVGLVPEDKNLFEYKEEKRANAVSKTSYSSSTSIYEDINNPFDFTSLTDTKILEEEPLKKQLEKELKKALYSNRKSAARFYDNESSYNYPLFDDY